VHEIEKPELENKCSERSSKNPGCTGYVLKNFISSDSLRRVLKEHRPCLMPSVSVKVK